MANTMRDFRTPWSGCQILEHQDVLHWVLSEHPSSEDLPRTISYQCFHDPDALQVQAGEPLRSDIQAAREFEATQLAAPSFQALITAWDHLAQRLPKQAGGENAAGVILNALKLVFALSHTDSIQQGADDTSAPASARMLALALQLADLAAQVHTKHFMPSSKLWYPACHVKLNAAKRGRCHDHASCTVQIICACTVAFIIFNISARRLQSAVGSPHSLPRDSWLCRDCHWMLSPSQPGLWLMLYTQGMSASSSLESASVPYVLCSSRT